MNIQIKNRIIGNDQPVFFIAEAGVNHNGSLDLGYQLIDIAVDAGADAVKFQTFKADKLNTKTAPKSTYHVETTGDDQKQTWYELLKTQEISLEMHKQLIEYCEQKGIIFLSTPYDEDSADLLDDLDIPAFKLASTDTNNLSLLRHVARKQKPMIISTAMCNMKEVHEAVDTIRSEGLEDFVVMQCTGNYPAQLQDSNLRVMSTYQETLGCLVGYSDHIPELINPVAGVALGACIYEKHFTINRSLPGPDHRMSLSPEGLKETIRAIRLTEQALGSAEKVILPSEEENRLKLRKSLVAAVGIPKGSHLTIKMVVAKRPGTGISPALIDKYLGKKIMIDIQQDSVLFSNMFEN